MQIFHPGHDTVGEYFAARLGFDPGGGVTVADWLLTPTQILASLTRGAVFHDPDGELARYRAAIAWYPGDVWRYALAAAWLKVSQEEAFVARTGSTGDELGSRIVADTNLQRTVSALNQELEHAINENVRLAQELESAQIELDRARRRLAELSADGAEPGIAGWQRVGVDAMRNAISVPASP